MAYVISQKAARALTRLVRGSSDATAPTYSPAAISPDVFPPPFTVRWSQSEKSGQGAWVIWLPYMPLSAGGTPAYGPLLIVGNKYVDFLQGTAALSPAQTLPTGWFVLRNNAEGGAVYMNILVPTFWSAAGYVTAAILTTPDSTPAGQDDYLHFSVLIATMTTDEDTGAKQVRQAVDSTIIVEGPIFGPNGEGIWPPGGGESTPQPFDIDNDVVVRCFAAAPCGTMLVGANYAIDGTKGDILVHVDRNSQGVYTLSVDQTHRAESPTHHEWTLYEYRGGDVVCDCRPRVLPLIRFDDKSLDIDATNHNLQIKDWNTGTPESGTTLAKDLHDADGVTAQGTLVERTTGGALNYKKIGTLAQLLGSTVNRSSQKILTGLTWSRTSHELVISSANITIANGVITSWTDNADAKIATTSISRIIPS